MRNTTRKVNRPPWAARATVAALVWLAVPGVALYAGQPTTDAATSSRADASSHEPIRFFGGQTAAPEPPGSRVLPEAASSAEAARAADVPPAGGKESQPIRHPGGQAGDKPVRADNEDELLHRSPARWGGFSWRAMAPLLVVLGLIVALALFLKRCMPGRRLLAGSGVIQVVARTSISARQSLVLVKMGSRLLLLGVSADGISTLASVDDGDEVARLVGEIASRQPDSMAHAFREAFADEAGKYGDESHAEDRVARVSGQVRGLLDKIRTLTRSRQVA